MFIFVDFIVFIEHDKHVCVSNRPSQKIRKVLRSVLFNETASSDVIRIHIPGCGCGRTDTVQALKNLYFLNVH